MNPPRGMVFGFISSLPATRPLVLPADVSMVFGLVRVWVGAHPRGLIGVFPPQCACSLAFICIYVCCRSTAACFHCSYEHGWSSSSIFWYNPVGNPSVKVSMVCGTSNLYSAVRTASLNSAIYKSISSPFILIPSRSRDWAFSLARLSANRLRKEAATSFHSLSSVLAIPPWSCLVSHQFTATTHSLTRLPLIYVRKNIACQ